MRISVWSSDVCSSDLGIGFRAGRRIARLLAHAGQSARCAWAVAGLHRRATRRLAGGEGAVMTVIPTADAVPRRRPRERARLVVATLAAIGFAALARSEEHTSELQSLMRISYAVFCLKKKNTKTLISTKH